MICPKQTIKTKGGGQYVFKANNNKYSIGDKIPIVIGTSCYKEEIEEFIQNLKNIENTFIDDNKNPICDVSELKQLCEESLQFAKTFAEENPTANTCKFTISDKDGNEKEFSYSEFLSVPNDELSETFYKDDVNKSIQKLVSNNPLCLQLNEHNKCKTKIEDLAEKSESKPLIDLEEGEKIKSELKDEIDKLEKENDEIEKQLSQEDLDKLQHDELTKKLEENKKNLSVKENYYNSITEDLELSKLNVLENFAQSITMDDLNNFKLSDLSELPTALYLPFKKQYDDIANPPSGDIISEIEQRKEKNQKGQLIKDAIAIAILGATNPIGAAKLLGEQVVKEGIKEAKSALVNAKKDIVDQLNQKLTEQVSKTADDLVNKYSPKF